jgi:hypothetical protein
MQPRPYRIGSSKPSRRIALAAAAEITAAVALGLRPAAAQSHDGWRRAAPFPQPLSEVYGAASGGKLYVFGGLDRGITPLGF